MTSASFINLSPTPWSKNSKPFLMYFVYLFMYLFFMQLKKY